MLNYNRIAYEIDTLGTPNGQQGGDNPQATQCTNITMLQHFDYPETWSYEGNAGLSDAAKFGKACAHFRDSNSYVRCTNTTGVYNLKAKGNAEAECFVKADKSSGIDTEILMKEALIGSGYSFYDGHVFKLYTTTKTWTDADSYCKTLGGHLVSVTSEEKRDFLGTILSGSGEAWTCGYYENGAITWLNGDTSDYVDWHTGHPDGNGPYIQLYNSNYTTPYHFDDIAPEHTRNFICEWDSLEAAYYRGQGYSFFNGHTFKYFSDTKTWTQAKALCEALGGHLATSTSAEKNTFLTTVATNTAWLGGTDEETEGTWKWITGEEWSYTNWKSGEPNNSNSAEHYLELNTNGTWNDHTSTETRGYICEWDYDIRTSSTIRTKLILWDNGIVEFEGHFLKCVGHDSYTWQQAKEKCESMGGCLASVTSAEKQTLIQSLCDNYAWLGGQEVNSQWTWLTGETWGYTNWNSGEPSESGDGVRLRKNPDGTWVARKTDINGRSICEWDSLEAAYYRGQGYSFFNGHTFKYFSDTKTWAQAKALCESLGGHLATAPTAEKNTFLTTLTTSSVWLGGTDEAEEGVWEWITGEEWSYTNWGSSQPDNSNGTEHYLQLNYANTGAWNDHTSTATWGYICEWDYDMRERAGSGVSSGNILCLSDNSNVISTSDAETQGYKFYNGHTFKYFSDNVLWPEAKAACEALGGHLATSTSAEKNTFLTTVSTNVVWLGAIDENKNDNWEWVTGEEWEYTNWASGDPNNLEEQYLMMNYSEMGKWYDETVTHTRAYICEWDYDIREPKQLTLSISNNGALNLQSAVWGLDETSTLTLEPDTWYHVLLRLSEGTASVYLNGAQALSGNVSGEDITPQSLTLGGYTGYMDEFVFRDEAGTGAPTVPTSAYETGTGTVATSNNAPVTRAVWTCEDLPEGLTLSSSGVLSGHPTTVGTYNCNVQVATNWGTAIKTITITVIE